MEASIRLLCDLERQIERGFVNFKKSPKERLTEYYATARLEILDKQYASFVEKHEELVKDYPSDVLEETSYIKDNVFDNVFDLFLDYKVQLQKYIKPTPSCASSDSGRQVSTASIQLPKIKLPTFSGKYIEWPSFRDLFVSLVHENESLDEIQKLHYLKTQLSGEAEQLVRHLPITKNNYDACWELLLARYNNKRFVSNCILKRLFNIRSINQESSSALKELLDTMTECLHELSNLGIDVTTWDIIVIYVVSLKLDTESRKQWELQVSDNTDNLPSLDKFKQFLNTRFRALEFLEPKFKTKFTSPGVSNPKVLHAAAVTPSTCPHCAEDHKLYNCKKFASENVDQRRSIVQTLGLCFNCLGYNHSTKVCRVFSKCRICKRKHHTLLHPKIQTDTAVAATAATNDTEIATVSMNETETNIATHFSTGTASRQVLLATALLKAESKNGSTQVLRALLDQGSQASFISEAAVQLLQLQKIATPSAISGLGGGQGGLTSKHTVMLNIQSLCDPSFTIQVKAHVLGTLTSVLPERKFTLVNWPEVHELKLADPHFSSPNKIDVLLGADTYCHIMKEGLLKGPQGTPIAQNTYLGWILSGQVEVKESCHNIIVNMHATVEENDLLRRLWELEPEPYSLKKRMTQEELACEEYFAATTRRDASGRYVVSLPFRCTDPPCKYGNSKSIAIKRLQGLERKFSANPEVKQRYSDVINEYLTLGHMERITKKDDRDNPHAVYLPHHAVIKEERTTSKVRVVFDASCKGQNGVSLNDTLMIGPTLQANLRHIVMKWRLHPIVLVADIVKMYRQVRVTEDHVDFQRIVWRENSRDEIQDYRLLTVTFGTASAPYLAVKALQQIADDEGQNYPLAAQIVKQDFYVDDAMTGCQTEHEAIEIYKQLNGLLEKGGFELQKWTSNSDKLLEIFKKDTGRNVEIKMDNVTKVLGLTWNRSSDQFDYSVKLPPLQSAPETKRTVISEISRLYDPLGWITPCIITFKVFIQRLWIAGIGWDENLPEDLLKEWKSYRSDLEMLNGFHIPRWVNTTVEDVKVLATLLTWLMPLSPISA